MSGIIDVAKGVIEIIELLKYFLNKKVRLVIDSTTQTRQLRPTIYELALWKRIAEGTVQSVVENPPSMLLKDVEEYTIFESEGVRFTETPGVLEGYPSVSKNLPTKKTYPQKFYLITSIKEIEPII